MSQLGKMEEQIDSFSPLHTSSQHNIAVSSDAFTQTSCSSGTSNIDENSLIAAHIQEMRALRIQLEETIKNNNSLKAQLEDRLCKIENDARQLHDPSLRVSLVRENDELRASLVDYKQQKQNLSEQLEELKEEKKK